MNWPWVSRARLEAAEEIISELRHDKRELREKVKDLHGQMERLVRVKTGMPRESNVPTRESIPDEVEEQIKAYDSRHIRTQLRHEVRQARTTGSSWEDILLELQRPAPAVLTPDAEDAFDMAESG